MVAHSGSVEDIHALCHDSLMPQTWSSLNAIPANFDVLVKIWWVQPSNEDRP